MSQIVNKISIGLIGYGTVGSGVVEFINKKKKYFKEKYQTQFIIKAVCDLDIKKRDPKGLGNALLTTNYKDVTEHPDIDVVIELIGGLHPAKEIVEGALNNRKHVITANKSLIASHGSAIFKKAAAVNREIYFESAVMAGVPIIKMITEGVAGNEFNGLFGIINGTCNYILSQMERENYSFEEALKEAQEKGFAEADPTLDINGMDSAHKLGILVYLAMGEFIPLNNIYTEGITHITHGDIEYAKSLNLSIKLLAIAKKNKNALEVRVHPTLVSIDHPLAAIHGVFNAIFLESDPLGDILLSGEGAGKMAAASGVISDLVNLAVQCNCNNSSNLSSNFTVSSEKLNVKSMDDLLTKYYIRVMALDKPGVLSKISGILGEHGISINSVIQKAHPKAKIIPIMMLTDFAQEKMIKKSLEKIQQLPNVKSKPIAIRMEDF